MAALNTILDKIKPQILERLDAFASVPRKKQKRELLLCLFTPQSSPFNAEASLVELEKLGIFTRNVKEQKIASVLRNPSHYIRFHNVKAKRVVRFLKNWPAIEQVLNKKFSPQKERELLTFLVEGFGLKEASHALRNIGRKNLAILDRHILRSLKEYCVIDKIPTSLRSKDYLSIEEKFRKFAENIGETMDVLDLFFWWQATGTIFK